MEIETELFDTNINDGDIMWMFGMCCSSIKQMHFISGLRCRFVSIDCLESEKKIDFMNIKAYTS